MQGLRDIDAKNEWAQDEMFIMNFSGDQHYV